MGKTEEGMKKVIVELPQFLVNKLDDDIEFGGVVTNRKLIIFDLLMDKYFRGK